MRNSLFFWSIVFNCDTVVKLFLSGRIDGIVSSYDCVVLMVRLIVLISFPLKSNKIHKQIHYISLWEGVLGLSVLKGVVILLTIMKKVLLIFLLIIFYKCSCLALHN